MKKTYGVAIIGCGHMGQAHVSKIYDKENVRMVYACDLDLERAAQMQRKYHVEHITDSAEICITSHDVDIVIIATYPSSHLPLLKKCIANKKHVICEKPVAINKEDGRIFLNLVKENPEVKVLVGYILRHNVTYNKVAAMIHGGAIGKPIIFRMVQNHHTMDWKKYLTLIKETSPIIDCGVHYIDVMQWFSEAKITDISGISARTEEDVPSDRYNYGMITVRLSDGSVGYYEAGWSNTMPSQNLKEFIGPKGSIRIVYRKDRHDHQEEGDLIEYYQYPEKHYELINVNCDYKPTDLQFDYLIQMIEKDAPAKPALEEVFESFSIALKADRIIKNTKKVERI